MRVGFVGWRGMVGSVLMQRMLEERDFDTIEPVFFSTSSAGGKAPAIGIATGPLQDANVAGSVRRRSTPIVTCQGGDWTNAMFPQLRDARLRRLLDRRGVGAADERRRGHHPRSRQPRRHRPRRRRRECSNYIGGNCTVSLMLMALAGLLRATSSSG